MVLNKITHSGIVYFIGVTLGVLGFITVIGYPLLVINWLWDFYPIPFFKTLITLLITNSFLVFCSGFLIEFTQEEQ